MDNQAIEIFAISAVKESVAISDYLSPFIADNDKEPSWDGHIYIYQNNSKKKSALRGRVAVQVKGILNEDFSKSTINYLVNADDLNNYLYDGGVVYFVVYVKRDGSKKIYCNLLTPIILQNELNNIKNKKTKTLKFQEFPTDGNEKASVLLNFFYDCQAQHSFSSSKLLSIKDFEKQGNIESINFLVSGYGNPNQDPINFLLGTQHKYFYIKTTGSSVLQPVKESLVKDIMVTNEEKIIISVGDQRYYDTIKRSRSKELERFIIGDSFTIEIKRNGEPPKFNFNTSNKLSSRINDLEFIVAVYENGGFSCNGSILPLSQEDFNSTGLNITECKEHLSYIQKRNKFWICLA